MRYPTISFQRWTRKAGALLGPLVFSFAGGHFRSAVTSQSVDALGRPIPWYTYPAVDFLSTLEVTQCRVAEFGSGNSTVWWASRAASVLALESDPRWFERVQAQLKPWPTASLSLIRTPQEAGALLPPDSFDIIIVDDGSGIGPTGRPLNAETALRRVKPTGIVIVDNSDTNYSRPGHYPIIELANELGFQRVDFHGHAAGSTKKSCTSLFFRPEVTLLSNLKPPSAAQIRRIGGSDVGTTMSRAA